MKQNPSITVASYKIPYSYKPEACSTEQALVKIPYTHNTKFGERSRTLNTPLVYMA